MYRNYHWSEEVEMAKSSRINGRSTHTKMAAVRWATDGKRKVGQPKLRCTHEIESNMKKCNIDNNKWQRSSSERGPHLKEVFIWQSNVQCLPKVVGTPIPFKDFPILIPFLCHQWECKPLPPSYNVESIAETFSYTKMHHFYVQGYSYLLHTT